jgi:MarR family transcriptional regulator, organic hydroperoxide resistance regulator
MSEFLALFTRAAKLTRARADEAFARHGVRLGQNLLLAALADEDGLTPGELAERLQVTTPTIVKMATRMESVGLLRRARDQKDARLVRIYLTDQGRAAHGPVEDERLRIQEQALTGFSDPERRAIESALVRVIRNLEDD